MTTQLSIPSIALSVKETQPFTALCFTTRATLQTLSQHYTHVADDLYREAARLELDIVGPIQWIYTGANGNEIVEFQLEIVLPISQPGAQSGEFSCKTFPSFRCAFYTHRGPWSDFRELYNALFSEFYRTGYQNDGHIREIYSIVDFDNLETCVTEIQIGIV